MSFLQYSDVRIVHIITIHVLVQCILVQCMPRTLSCLLHNELQRICFHLILFSFPIFFSRVFSLLMISILLNRRSILRRRSKSWLIFLVSSARGRVGAHLGVWYANEAIWRLIHGRFDSICFADFDASAARDFTD